MDWKNNPGPVISAAMLENVSSQIDATPYEDRLAPFANRAFAHPRPVLPLFPHPRQVPPSGLLPQNDVVGVGQGKPP